MCMSSSAVAALALLALFGSSSSSADGSNTAALGAAVPVLERYFDALKAGDVRELGVVLGGDLLARQRPLLENPIYPNELIAAFGNADFRVVDWSWKRSKAISVDVAVLLDQDESVKWRLTMTYDGLAKTGIHIVDLKNITE